MIRLASLLVADADTATLAPLLARIEAAGYHLVDAGDRPVQRARMDRPDLIMIGEAGGDPVELGLRLKNDPDCANIPVVVLADEVHSSLAARAAAAGLDEVLSRDADDTELLARLRPLVRLSTMHAELRHRHAVAALFGVAAPDHAPPPPHARASVLVVGDDPDHTASLLTSEADMSVAPTLYDAERMLEQHNFDAAILPVPGNGESELAFAAQVRHNPRLFNLPIVAIVNDHVTAMRGYRRGASRTLQRPIHPVMLRAAVMVLVRRQQVRWSVRGLLGHGLRSPTRDPATEVYSRAFLDQYLASRLGAAQRHDRPLAVVIFAIPSLGPVSQHFGAEAAANLRRQLGQWIVGLVRAEDLTAAFADNRFCVVLPDTPLAEAEVVMHRIAAVLSNTDFAVPDVYQPVRVWVQVGCTDIRLDDDGASVLARAAARLDEAH